MNFLQIVFFYLIYQTQMKEQLIEKKNIIPVLYVYFIFRIRNSGKSYPDLEYMFQN